MPFPYPSIFTPLKLNQVMLKNRIVFGAHTTNMSDRGLPGARHRAYYLERAIGGAAMIVVEPVPVHPTGVLTRGNFLEGSDRIIPHFRRITQGCHAHGAVMIQQLYHVGQHGDGANSYLPNWSASGLASLHDSDGGHAMSEAEIEEVIAAFVAAAVRARECGFDGVEVFAAYHALIDQFWTPWSNRRSDRWGGSFDNRMRISTEILGRIRARCGKKFVIGLAVAHDAKAPAALKIEDLQDIARWHDERGLMDYITCGTGSYFRAEPIIPTHLHEGLEGASSAARLKEAVRHARVQAESRIDHPDKAEAIIAAGRADLCSLVRAQIADAHLVAKTKAMQPERIRPCIACNQQCIARRYRDYWISCLVNPSAGREWQWGGDRIKRSGRARHVVVVGAGPGGLEAARVAAERGARVTLIEKAQEIGGQWRLAARQPTRQRIADHIQWYAGELARLGVRVRLGEEAAAAAIAAEAPDHVIVATGVLPVTSGFQRALPMTDTLPGAGHANVMSCHAVLEGGRPIGERVLVVDDLHSWRGLGTGLFLAEAGHKVTMMTAKPVLGTELAGTGADGPARARFAQVRGRALTDTALAAWGEPGNDGSRAAFICLLTGATFAEHFDTLVLATVATPDTRLADALAAQDGPPAFTVIGDCNAPRKAHMAIYEGRKAALAL
jgi:2,4-dienoyl-CoA reductase-like NADH-dependent reductase (Old Yellow Enzyme family)